jgi:hypothetical protein
MAGFVTFSIIRAAGSRPAVQTFTGTLSTTIRFGFTEKQTPRSKSVA